MLVAGSSNDTSSGFEGDDKVGAGFGNDFVVTFFP